MKVNALLMNEKDNVVTCIAKVEQGGCVIYRKGDEYLEVPAKDEIPAWHKIALIDLAEGEHVLKYGESIGCTKCAIERGSWVHDNIYSVPRDYDSEMI